MGVPRLLVLFKAGWGREEWDAPSVGPEAEADGGNVGELADEGGGNSLF